MNQTSNETNGQTIDQQVFKQRKDEFAKALQALQEEHGIVVVPYLDVTNFGIVPTLQLADKAQYEKQVAKVMAGMQDSNTQA